MANNAAAAARSAVEQVVGPQRAALLLKEPTDARSLALAPTALVLYNLSCLRRVGQVTAEEAARVKKFVLSSGYFQSLKAAGAFGSRGGGRASKHDQRRDKELARLREEGHANRLVRQRYLTASLELVEEWEAEQSRFLNAALSTIYFASRNPGLGLSTSSMEHRQRLVRQLDECTRVSVQLARSLDMKSHPLVAGKVLPGMTLLGAKGATFRRFGGHPVWLLLDPPNLHFYHMKAWSESLAAWDTNGGAGANGANSEDHSNDSIVNESDMSMSSIGSSAAGSRPGGGGADGSHNAEHALTLALDQVESCTVSTLYPDRVDLVVSVQNASGGKDELKLDFRTVGPSSTIAGLILGAAAAVVNGAAGGGAGGDGNGDGVMGTTANTTHKQAAAQAAAAWKYQIDTHLGWVGGNPRVLAWCP
jgi:hypothetical protein